MRNRTGKDVADRVDNPEAVINGKRAAHVGKADEGDDSEYGPNQNQLARTETMDDHRAEPDSQGGSQRKSQCDVGAGPAKVTLEIIVEESDVVIRDAYREAKGEKGRGGDPPAEELALHRLHSGTTVYRRPNVGG